MTGRSRGDERAHPTLVAEGATDAGRNGVCESGREDVPDDALEPGRRLFAGACRFVHAAADAAQLPPAGLPEVAFAGRSNVGKSSLVNALTGRKSLARTSNTPGRTQALIFFDLAGRLGLVDLPGYGYAKVSKTKAAAWTALTRDYLAGRATLRRLCLLVDARHGLKPSDAELMELLDRAAVVYQVVLTKIDKLALPARERAVAGVEAGIARRAAAHPDVIATSARDGDGVPRLRAELAALAEEPGP